MIISLKLPHCVTSALPSFIPFLHPVAPPTPPPPLKNTFWNPTSTVHQQHSHSTSLPAESTWKQFSFNQVHHKRPSDANLNSNTVVFFYFSSAPSLYNILIFHERDKLVFTDLNFFGIDCSFRTSMGRFAQEGPIFQGHKWTSRRSLQVYSSKQCSK